MLVSENWLREWVDPPVTIQQLADTLTMAGLEVGGMAPAAPAFSGVVVAKVVAVEKHPDAERLRICTIDDGSTKPVTVVCGAENARSGLMVAFAKVGAVLPYNFEIEVKSFHGIESFGMLCSAAELGLASSSQDIFELSEDYELGADVYASLALNDVVLDMDLTPNRSDCLSIQGLAREVSALLNTDVRDIGLAADIEGISRATVAVSVETPEDCPRYVGRVIEGVSGKAQSPLWMQEKLRRAGIHSVNAIVDITNYVMLELGQPMHAFDFDKLHDDITVRFASSTETLMLLDDQVLELNVDDLVVADARGPVALAGVMGGKRTAVDHQTRNILLESALFKPETIAGKARHYKLYTDSSHRFERGVDPHLTQRALHRATQLILELVGGTAGVVVCEEYKPALPQPVQINLEHTKVEALLGIRVSVAKIQELLESLHCSVQVAGNSLRVVPPSFRFDLTLDVDLIEEVARLVGYENIPAKTTAVLPVRNLVTPRVDKLALLKQALVFRGYHEVISFSFVDQSIEKLLNPKHDAKELTNPISQEMSVMRSKVWAGLLKAAQHNLNRQQTRIRMFEHGLQFVHGEKGFMQLPVLSGLISGDCKPQQWASESRKVDFYDIKGDVERLLEIAVLSREKLHFEILNDSALHPGQAAKILLDNKLAGQLGKLHPRVQSALNFNQEVFLFELRLNELLQGTSKVVFQPLSKYPLIRRDVTLTVDKAVSVAEILSSIERLGISCLKSIEVFSVYTGENIPNAKKSISLGLILQELSRTLTDKEVEKTTSLIISELVRRVEAEIRS